MSQIRKTIITVLNDVLEEDDLTPPEWLDATVLLESGLDSLGFAVVVSRLEEELGKDPFSLMEDAVYPRTFSEFVKIYSD